MSKTLKEIVADICVAIRLSQEHQVSEAEFVITLTPHLEEYVRQQVEASLRTRLNLGGMSQAMFEAIEAYHVILPRPSTPEANQIDEQPTSEDCRQLIKEVQRLHAILSLVERDEPDLIRMFEEGWKCAMMRARRVVEEYVPDANQLAGALERLEVSGGREEAE